MYNHILVAIGAYPNLHAVALAVGMAIKHGARMSVLHVADSVPYAIASAGNKPRVVIDVLQPGGYAVIDEVADVLDTAIPHMDVEFIALPSSGRPIGQTIATYASSIRADLIVLGRRKSGWWRCFEEDVCSRVQQHADAQQILIAAELPKKRPAPPAVAIQHALQSREDG
ncbi:universal stress protein [Dyella sp. RRB7]|uniref:universal stress protein n=1 Tax=Dyella sp. RRB7 TaxID=2919502 RepID=UPI001FAA6401|nr:universal stress protein [Dyella sp. RRB7]